MDDVSDLHNKNCIPCKGGISPFAISEIHKYLKKVDGWDVKKKEDELYFLEKTFSFSNFVESQKFVNQVGNIAEQEGHHPDIIFGWGYAKIQIFTHKIKGLVESDFILASKVDQITL
jgi:4a-hydroxytetrahydrobiopterin dehydratase